MESEESRAKEIRVAEIPKTKDLMDKVAQALTRLISLAILFILMLGCGTGGGDSVVQKLDRDRGIENFVVGDSLYPSLQNQLEKKDGTVEYSVLNSVITPYREIELPQRFLFGLEVKRVRVRANGGRISAINLWLGELRQKVHQKVRDSLLARYGEPMAVIDTSGAIFPEEERKIRRWKGQSVWLQETQFRNESSDEVSVQLRVLNQDVLQETRRLRSSTDSLLRERGTNTIDRVGEFPLLSTSDHRMVETVERERALGDSTYKDQVLPYKHLEPFFGLPNPMGPLQEDRVINADVSYDQETDSLSSLSISIRGKKYDPESLLERSTYEGAEKAREVTEDRLGEPHLVVRDRRIPNGESEIVEDRTRYWYYPPFIVKEEPLDSPAILYGEGVSILFSRVEETLSEKLAGDLFPDEVSHYGWK
jgi:hypothetical protein